MSKTSVGPHYPVDSATGAPQLIAGDTTIIEGQFWSPRPASAITYNFFNWLLSGDQQSGADKYLLSGDQQTGADRVRGKEPA